MFLYFIFSPGWYILCSNIHVTSIPYLSDKCVNSLNFDSQFGICTFIVEKFTFRLHFRSLEPVACLSISTWCSIESRAPYLPARWAMPFVELLVVIVIFILQLLNKMRGRKSSWNSNGSRLTGACLPTWYSQNVFIAIASVSWCMPLRNYCLPLDTRQDFPQRFTPHDGHRGDLTTPMSEIFHAFTKIFC